MSDIEFGDITPDDVWCAEGEPDDEQVAYRLHELRRLIDSTAGRDPGAFDELTTEEQMLAMAIGGVVVEWLITTDSTSAELAARRLHNVRRYWSGNTLPEWGQLSGAERRVASFLMNEVIVWLQREGSLR